MRYLLILLLLALSSCVFDNPYQKSYDQYALQINKAVQDGSLDVYEGEQLKMDYANQLNAQASQRYYDQRASLSRISNNLRSNKTTNCTTRPDYLGGYKTVCR